MSKMKTNPVHVEVLRRSKAARDRGEPDYQVTASYNCYGATSSVTVNATYESDGVVRALGALAAAIGSR
jgi:hypothetical protein